MLIVLCLLLLLLSSPVFPAVEALASSSSSSSFPVLFDSSNHLHRDIQYHPEQPARIESCVKALVDTITLSDDDERLELIDVAPLTSAASFEGVDDHQLRHEPFSDAELAHAHDMLLQAHTKDLVIQLEERCCNSKQRRLEEGKPALGHVGYIDFDTFVTTESFDVCLRATAAWIRATDMVLGGSGGAAMALTRPPGHHATAGMSNGFCLYNFCAAAALHVLQQDPNKRVSILDWDVHYGQGVADILKKHDRARYVSIHQCPAFPYMGETRSVGGTFKNIMTIPIPADTTWTCGYGDVFEKALDFVCKPGEWEPDVVIVCAGYDALDSDELANVSLQAQDFGVMARRLWEHLTTATTSSSSSNKKRPAVVLGLEGGYQLSSMAGGGNLQDAVVQTVKALMEQT